MHAIPIPLVLALVLPVAHDGTEPVDFTLPDLDGRPHRLADLRGSVVVLEWTNHLCPAVADELGAGLPMDTRRALRDEVAWWTVDSSWYARALAEDVRGWRAGLTLSGPYLLDADGAVAEALGVRTTPSYVVLDREGRVAYRGGLGEGGFEPERRNRVLEAARALLAGEAPEVREARAPGCTLKLGDPARTVERSEIQDGVLAEGLYREGAREAQPEQALACFEAAVREGLERPWRILSDAAFAPVLARAELRERVREELAGRPAHGRVAIVSGAEPGEPLVLCGTVRDGRGEPVPGALVSLYQTDAAGWYSAGSTSGRNARLFGRVRTDGRGRYRVRTIVPGHYADAPDSPAHVHMGFSARGFRAFGGHRASVYFADDPALVGANLEEIRSDGCAIVTPGRTPEGVRLVLRDAVLERE